MVLLDRIYSKFLVEIYIYLKFTPSAVCNQFYAARGLETQRRVTYRPRLLASRSISCEKWCLNRERQRNLQHAQDKPVAYPDQFKGADYKENQYTQ